MKKYLYIAIGGALGAIARDRMGQWEISGHHGNFPVNTLLINILGSFFISVIITLALIKKKPKEDLKLAMTVGFLGSFTTFSAFSKEIVVLLETGQANIAAVYVFLSILLGLGAVYLGNYLMKKVLTA